jgi:hypothetical protein
MFKRIPNLEQSTEFLCLCADKNIAIDRAGHDTRVLWSANTKKRVISRVQG